MTGYCACGCGRKTELAKWTNKKWGHVKGQPVTFLKGHNKTPTQDVMAARFRALDPGDGGCWEWDGPGLIKGYGYVDWRGKRWAAHRLSYTLLVGPIADGLFVCHHCDVRACVNPNHLFLGTAKDNLRDMTAKGRNVAQANPLVLSRGERHWKAKFTEADVLAIRRAARRGVPVADLAASYAVAWTTISSVVRRKTWTHLP